MARIKGYGKAGKEKNGKYSNYGKEIKAKAAAKEAEAEINEAR